MIDLSLWILSTAPVALLVYVWLAASLAALFTKAGEEGWKGWVPFYNLFTLLELAGVSGWLVLLLLVPIAGQVAFIVVFAVAAHRINLDFGYGLGMTVLAVLLLPVWSSVLGWGSARWLGGPRRGRAPGAVRGGAGRRGEVVQPGVPGAPPMVGGYSIPPRPPAPGAPATRPATRAGSPTAAAAVDGQAEPWSFAPPPRASSDTDGGAPAYPALRSTARGTHVRVSHDDLDDVTPSPAVADPPVRARAPWGSAEPAPSARSAAAPASVPGGSVAPPPVPPAPPVPPVVAPGAASASPATPVPPVTPDADTPFETSFEVSAVEGAPSLGSPRAARSSVSSQHRRPEIPENEDAFDETIVASRRRTPWMLVPPLGAPIAVTSNVLIVGRRPAYDDDFADAQLVPVSDETRTMSKTHARLELRDEGWVVVDLSSTNGVVLIGDDGEETDAVPGFAVPLTERFLLGDAELKLVRTDRA